MLTIRCQWVHQWEGLLCSPLGVSGCISGRVCCAHHWVSVGASVGGSAVLTIGCQWVHQWEGLMCSPLGVSGCISGRVCCAHHWVSVGASVGGSDVLAIGCISGSVCCARHWVSVGGSAVLAIRCQWVHQWEGLLCSPLGVNGCISGRV